MKHLLWERQGGECDTSHELPGYFKLLFPEGGYSLFECTHGLGGKLWSICDFCAQILQELPISCKAKVKSQKS